MPTPGKPLAILKAEGKSHRTKAELKQREQGEKSVLTGKKMKAREEVKNNHLAYAEFKRLGTVLDGIDKNDSVYEVVINRYCLLYAETVEIQKERQRYTELIETVAERCEKVDDDETLIKLVKSLSTITSNINKLDSTLQVKRKMMLDIEKENIMTIASALRSIPKKVEKSTGPSLKEILSG